VTTRPTKKNGHSHRATSTMSRSAPEELADECRAAVRAGALPQSLLYIHGGEDPAHRSVSSILGATDSQQACNHEKIRKLINWEGGAARRWIIRSLAPLSAQTLLPIGDSGDLIKISSSVGSMPLRPIANSLTDSTRGLKYSP
jgi:hypothetical protein